MKYSVIMSKLLFTSVRLVSKNIRPSIIRENCACSVGGAVEDARKNKSDEFTRNARGSTSTTSCLAAIFAILSGLKTYENSPGLMSGLFLFVKDSTTVRWFWQLSRLQ